MSSRFSKQTIYTIDYLPTRTEIRFIPHVCYFYHPSIAASEAGSLTTLFSTKMRGEETQSQEHQHPCLSNL